MDWTRKNYGFGLAAVFVILAAAVPALAQTGGAMGKVTLQDGTLCDKCIVVLDRQEIKGHYQVKTNKKGQFVYIGLPMGSYKIILENPSGQTLFFFNGKHISSGDPTQIDFDLPKELKAQQEAHPEIEQKMQEQQKEQKQMAGLKSLFTEANGLYTDKKYPEAADKYEQALPLATGKNKLVVLERLADSYDKAKQTDKAIATYQQALQLDPQNGNLHNNLGNVYANMGKVDEAKAEFQKAAEVDPTGASQYYFNFGAVLYNTGNMDEAVTSFKKAIDLDPKFANAYFWLGQALMGKATTGAGGKVVAAPGTKEAFETYLKLDPNGPNVQAAQALLQTIEGGVDTEYNKKKKH
jgi:tetratricopeptide (TPR) repeat protein